MQIFYVNLLIIHNLWLCDWLIYGRFYAFGLFVGSAGQRCVAHLNMYFVVDATIQNMLQQRCASLYQYGVDVSFR